MGSSPAGGGRGQLPTRGSRLRQEYGILRAPGADPRSPPPLRARSPFPGMAPSTLARRTERSARREGRALSIGAARIVPGPGPEIQTQEEGLTTHFENLPAEHDGTNAFEFRIAFGEAIKIGFLTFRDHSLSVIWGTVTKAKRVNKRRDLWEVRVAPSSNEAVIVSLPVNYAIADGSATPGADYTAASGTLTLAPGESERTVSVAVLDDTHDEGEETLTLSNTQRGAHRGRHRARLHRQHRSRCSASGLPASAAWSRARWSMRSPPGSRAATTCTSPWGGVRLGGPSPAGTDPSRWPKWAVET